MSKRGVKATIFIPTYNGEAYLDDILKAIFKQQIDGTFEVLIIDSGSKDKTISIIRKYQKKYNNLLLHEIPNSEFGHGKTRNLAAQMARGEIVVYLSHDAVPAHKHWLYEMLKPFEINEKIVGVTGKQDPRPNCSPLLRFEIQAVFRNMGPDYGTTVFYKDDFIKNKGLKDAVSFYSDVNSATRRDFLINHLPYRDVPYSEDQMFGEDVINAGYYKVYAPRANVIHSNDLKLAEYKHRIFDETMGLRKIKRVTKRPSKKTILNQVAQGIYKDTYRIIVERSYTWKRKLYWLAINPLFHIEKWRGVNRAFATKLDDESTSQKYSLEKRRR